MQKFMKNRILKLLIVPVLLTVSCTNLDEDIYDSVLTDSYGKTESEIQTIVGRAYASLRGYTEGKHYALEFTWFLNECSSDEAVIPTRGTDWYDGGVHQDIQRHQWKTTNDLVKNTWEMLFSGVTKVNSIIYEVDRSALSDEQKSKIKAELRGLRAYYYYRLCDMFGNVPLQTDYTDLALKAKSPRADVYDFIESELLAIIETLPATGYGKFTRAAGYSLLARLYLNAKVFRGVEKWEACINACDQVTGYSLEPNFFNNFLTNNDASAENIFVIPYDEKVTVGNYQQSLTLHYKAREAFQINAACVNGICAEPDIYGKFEDNDVRKKSMLHGPLLAPDGTQLLQDDGNPINHTPEITSLTAATQSEGVRNVKYQITKGDNWERSNDWVVIRYAEVMLMKAEALLRLNRPEQAQPLIAAVRKRAGLETPASVDLDLLYDELLREFLWEEHRRTDNIRFGKFGQTWWEKGVSDDNHQIFPIPQTAIAANGKLIQNDGY